MFKAIIEHFHGPGFDGPYEHVVADHLHAISTGGSLGRRPREDGVKGKEGPELSLTNFVFTEVVQREVHAQRIDPVNLRSAKAVHSSSQTSQVVIARDGCSVGACEDGADTRDEARRAGAGGGPTTLDHASQRRSQPASAPLRSSRMPRMSFSGHPVKRFCLRVQNSTDSGVFQVKIHHE